jgi:hypothetical protein
MARSGDQLQAEAVEETRRRPIRDLPSATARVRVAAAGRGWNGRFDHIVHLVCVEASFSPSRPSLQVAPESIFSEGPALGRDRDLHGFGGRIDTMASSIRTSSRVRIRGKDPQLVIGSGAVVSSIPGDSSKILPVGRDSEFR